MLEKELEKYTGEWKDVSVIPAHWDNNAVLIVLIFDKKNIGKQFVELLSKHDFAVTAENNEGFYTFGIRFPSNNHIGVERPTGTPFGHYKLLEWYKEGRRFFITSGVWLDKRLEMRLSDYGNGTNVHVKKMFFE